MKENKRRKIFVDFEWHHISGEYKEERLYANNEIIEFGAIMLDSKNQELRRFKSYVKPRYVKCITKKIQRLTGITDEILAEAPDFITVLTEFIAWCEKGRGNYDIFSWSDSDLIQIKEEMALKGVKANHSTEYMISNWFDLQDEFDGTLGFERQLSLKNALYTAGLDAIGTEHDALDDARNTATLYNFLTNPDKQRTTIAQIRSVLVPEERGTTLGDIFDWSQFAVAVS